MAFPVTLCALLYVFLPSAGRLAAAAENARASTGNVHEVLAEFSETWPKDRIPYRTEEDTESWKTYALSLKRLVAMGEQGVPGLITGCEDDNFQVRALSARVLGYLQASASVPKLIELLQDESGPVAVQAADSLGQIWDSRGLAALRAARGREQRGDVLLHINKSLERQGPLENGVIEQIMMLDRHLLDSAEVGQLAPDFTLQDVAGKLWTLADQRGKKSVVLVFIYGDG